MNFGNITDTRGQTLPEFIFKMENVPPQIGSEAEAAVILAAGVAASVMTASIVSSNFALSLVLGASLSSVWSLLNSQ